MVITPALQLLNAVGPRFEPARDHGFCCSNCSPECSVDFEDLQAHVDFCLSSPFCCVIPGFQSLGNFCEGYKVGWA